MLYKRDIIKHLDSMGINKHSVGPGTLDHLAENLEGNLTREEFVERLNSNPEARDAIHDKMPYGNLTKHHLEEHHKDLYDRLKH